MLRRGLLTSALLGCTLLSAGQVWGRHYSFTTFEATGGANDVVSITFGTCPLASGPQSYDSAAKAANER